MCMDAFIRTCPLLLRSGHEADPCGVCGQLARLQHEHTRCLGLLQVRVCNYGPKEGLLRERDGGRG